MVLATALHTNLKQKNVLSIDRAFDSVFVWRGRITPKKGIRCAGLEGPGSSYKCTAVRHPQIRPQIRYSFGLKSAMSDKGVTCNICDLCQKRDKCQKKILPAARQ